MLPSTSALRRLATKTRGGGGSRFGGSSSSSSSSASVVMTVMAPPPFFFSSSSSAAAAGVAPTSPTSRSLSSAAAAATTTTATNKKKNKKGGSGGNDDGSESSSSSSSYFARKAALKEQRRATYQHKIAMNDKRRSRRVGTQHHLKPNFSSWFDAVKAHDERLERKARQQQQQQQMQKGSSTNNNNKLWKIQVACVVERLPVVMPDKPSWLQDFIELQEYEQQFGKQYPSEFVGHNNAETYLKAFTGDDMKPPTDDELMAMLPENFKPAPRETAADLDGSVDTLDRKLKDRVYLMFTNDDDGDDDSQINNGSPYFPTTTLEDEENESLLQAAQRALREHLAGSSSSSSSTKKRKTKTLEGGDDDVRNLPLDLYCPSNMPIAVRLEENKDGDSEYFGTKTFYMKVQYDDGKITSRDVSNGRKFCWLDRQEIVDQVAAAAAAAAAPTDASSGDDDQGDASGYHATDTSKFYQYML